MVTINETRVLQEPLTRLLGKQAAIAVAAHMDIIAAQEDVSIA